LVGALTVVTVMMCGERREHEASFVEGGVLHVFSQCQAAEVLAVRFGNIRRVFI
jgi:hypothetical protein